MNKDWSLDVYYTGYDDPKFAADEAKLDSLIAEAISFCGDLSGEPADVLRKGILMEQELDAVAEDLFGYSMLRQSVNTSDAEAAAALITEFVRGGWLNG